ncbi:N-acetyldiaminopimelate deacetylase [Slackia heliotrinireducens]|uniref:Amidohydrolase n=1 Tax=Slackia heliotrinireducens (strain ATCC 29202 / DSM 20476 / NCTC 11029 / RHS 1) TaxID=471855 RepID=C7N473_SLAHD|nr:amidohydrolase [Slackia heliotrinireducens]ACV23809.1 amidohydrolase [Slackia heliotrinireducens DSM 20476]VEH03491.1 N-acetyldiaminopimelate deacetylase [Slackia heliotrinireducens]
MSTVLLSDAERAELQPMLTRWRRDLHRIPELDFDLPKTMAYIQAALEPLPCEVLSPCESTLCAWFDRGSEHATAIRTDMDALPVTEVTGVEFTSTHPGQMHACGHDGHMSMALGLAHHVARHLDELDRSVLIVFQPAEETTGGAKVVCESGVFERYNVDRIFGFHLWPDLPKDSIASRPGPLLAAANETTVTFTGKSSHIAKADQGRDALQACSHFLIDVYQYIEERQKEEPCLLKFGCMTAGSVRNAIAANARIAGSLRTFSLDMRERARREIAEIADAAAARFGCTAETVYSEGYPPVINNADVFDLAAAALPELDTVPEPLLIAEDFAWYQQYLPGVFILLGTGTGIPLHADTFNFDEDILMRGVETYAKLVRIP